MTVVGQVDSTGTLSFPSMGFLGGMISHGSYTTKPQQIKAWGPIREPIVLMLPDGRVINQPNGGYIVYYQNDWLVMSEADFDAQRQA